MGLQHPWRRTGARAGPRASLALQESFSAWPSSSPWIDCVFSVLCRKSRSPGPHLWCLAKARLAPGVTTLKDFPPKPQKPKDRRARDRAPCPVAVSVTGLALPWSLYVVLSGVCGPTPLALMTPCCPRQSLRRIW